MIALKFREANRDIFEAIKSGIKKVETRAATEKYRGLKGGEKVKLICGTDTFQKEIVKVTIFASIEGLLKKYRPEEINPKVNSREELAQMFYSFPGYKEKIKQFGFVAIELE